MAKTALVLEGGSLRCMFSAGILDVLMEENLECNGVFGVSAGCLTGVNYVSRQPGRTAKVNLDYVNDRRYMGIRNLLLHKSIFNFDFLFGEICTSLVPLDYKALEENPCAFTVVATSCITGQPVYREKSSCSDLFAAMRASSSLPLLSPMVLVDGEPCLDGGISIAVPYAQAIKEGYDKIVVITTREHGFRKTLPSRHMAKMYAHTYRKYPQLVKTLLDIPRMYAREMDEIDRLEAGGQLFVLRPEGPITVSRTEKDTTKLQALYEEGKDLCRKQLSSLKTYLNT